MLKHGKNVVILLLVLVIGGLVTATLDWERERRDSSAKLTHAAERLIRLLSLYPLAEMTPGTRNLLAKTLVEQPGPAIAYLSVTSGLGSPLLTLGSSAQDDAAGPGLTAATISPPRRFRAADGKGDIVAYARPFLCHDGIGTIRLGLRAPAPPLLSAARVSSIAAVMFFMAAALIIGYYLILRAVRHWAPAPGVASASGAAGPRPVVARRTDDVLLTIESMSNQLSSIREVVRETRDRNADLSSKLGLASFEAQQAYRILDGFELGILVLDGQDHISRVNRKLLMLLGEERAALEGRFYGDVMEHEGLLKVLDGRGDRNLAAAAGLETRFEATAPDQWFQVTCRPLPDVQGDSIGTVITVHDISAMQRVRNAQDDFIAAVAHELLTPLTSLKAYAELLATDSVRDESIQRDFLNTLNGETDRLTALIRNLLNVSRMESGSLTIQRDLVRTDWLLKQSLPAIEAAARDKGIAISKRLPDTFPNLVGDKELLKIILVNLLGNAVKYTPEGGSITFAAFPQNHSMIFEITDTGCGISAKELPHLFEKFYRGESAAVRDQRGSGLGLATAEQIVKLHGGTIDVTSEPGQGSCFTVKLPVGDTSLENA